MKQYVLAALAAVFVGGIAEAATLSSTFDTDADGWTGNVPEGALSYVATGGNPGGHIRLTDTGAGVINGFASGALAGPSFSGDLSAFDGGTLSFDMITITGGGGTFASFGTVFLFAAGDANPGDQTPDAMADAAAVAPTSAAWQNYSLTFDAATFGVSQTAWDAILANVDTIGIATDAFSGADTIGLDNFTLTDAVAPVPLPATALLLLAALGGLAGLRRRR